MRNLLALGMILGVPLAAAPALAQNTGFSFDGQANPQGANTETNAYGQQQQQQQQQQPAPPQPMAQQPMAQPPPPPPPPPPVPAPAPMQQPQYAEQTDHEKMSSSFAVGYLGRVGMRIGAVGTLGGGAGEEISAPVIGMRLWFSPKFGLDAGIGFSRSSSVTGPQGDSDVDDHAPTAFILHGGAPIVLSDSQHLSIQVVPQLDLGYATALYEAQGAGEIAASGLLVSVSARLGGELHFGFIGIPNLSLQAGVGLGFDYTKVSAEDDNGEGIQSTFQFGTAKLQDPWDLFTGNVAALYYF